MANIIIRNKKDILAVVSIIESGLPIIFPTETVYGIGVISSNTDAIKSLYNLKKRDTNKPFSLYFPDIDRAKQYIEAISDYTMMLMKDYLPGPLTLIVKANTLVNPIIKGKNNSVAIRIPDEMLTLELLKRLKEPLAGTSANISGERSAINAFQALQSFPEDIAAVIDAGQSKLKQESTIVDCTGVKPVIIRQGALAIDI